jgi:hypothetical protein
MAKKKIQTENIKISSRFLFMFSSRLLYYQKIVVVGMPVSRHPPHSPGPAVFPHPVPRLYSLPHRFISTRTDADASFPLALALVSARVQPLGNQPHKGTVIDPFLHHGQQFIMVDVIKGNYDTLPTLKVFLKKS